MMLINQASFDEEI
jgi:hypothetical protein